MRLCIVSEFFYPDMTGGTGMLLSDLARSLHDTFGVEVDVITTRHLYRDTTAKLPRQENWNGINIFRVPAPNFNRAGTKRRLVGNLLFSGSALSMLLSRKRYDVVLTATAPPTVPSVAQAYEKLTKTPYLYVIYDLEPDRVVRMEVMGERSRPVQLLRRLQRGWLASASKVIVIGRCMANHLTENYGLAPERMEVLATGADSKRIVPRSRETALRDRLGLTGFVVLYAGNFGKYHNFNTILDAAKRLQKADVPITFAMIGNGAQEQTIKARVADEKIDNVKVFPILPQNEVSDLLASADVSLVTLEPNMEGLCVPSKFYPILASGRPTIALVGERSEVARVIAEADCGIRLDQGDTDKLVEVLTRLSGQPDEVARMGRNARQVLEEKYDLEHLTRQYYMTLQEAVSARADSRKFSAFSSRKSGLGVAHTAELESSSEKV